MRADPSKLTAQWDAPELPRVPALTAADGHARRYYPTSPSQVSEQVLAIVVRSLELFGEDDALGVASVPLLQIELNGPPQPFVSTVLRGSRACGVVYGEMQLRLRAWPKVA